MKLVVAREQRAVAVDHVDRIVCANAGTTWRMFEQGWVTGDQQATGLQHFGDGGECVSLTRQKNGNADSGQIRWVMPRKPLSPLSDNAR